jgi:hypothetical protein
VKTNRSIALSSIGLGCLVAFGALSACRAIVGSYEVGPTQKDTGATDANVDVATEGGSDSTPSLDSSDDGVDTAVAIDTADAGPLSSCRAYLAANPASPDGVYALAAKEGPVRAWCDMTRDKKGYTLVATRSASTSSDAWRSESAVTKTLELVDPIRPDDAVLAIDWTQLGFDEVIYELGPPPTPTRALFPSLTTEQKSGARGALSLLPPPEKKPTCIVDSISYPACSPPGADGGPPPGDPGRGLGWLFSPTGVSCWWAWSTSLGAQECKTAKVGGGRVWVR